MEIYSRRGGIFFGIARSISYFQYLLFDSIQDFIFESVFDSIFDPWIVDTIQYSAFWHIITICLFLNQTGACASCQI